MKEGVDTFLMYLYKFLGLINEMEQLASFDITVMLLFLRNHPILSSRELRLFRQEPTLLKEKFSVFHKDFESLPIRAQTLMLALPG